MAIKITKETLKDGSIRWRARGVSTGKDPLTGKRTQRTVSGKTKGEVEREVRRIGTAVDRNTYVKPWNGSVSDVLDSYLRAATRGKEANTVAAYKHSLRIPRERLGQRRALSVTRDDVEALVDFALTEGRARGGKPGTGLGGASVRGMLGRLSASFEMAVDDGRLPRNPARKVSAGKRTKRDYITWSEDEANRFLAVADADRLAPVWRLYLYGLRRGEAAGLEWDRKVRVGTRTRQAVDLDAGTVTIGPTRVVVSGKIIGKDTPKSANGWRTLPLDKTVTAQLRALRDLQQIEAITAGAAYEGGLHVASDELGRPVNPEWLSTEFHRLAARAGCPRIRLHDTRHTSNTLMAAAGVPVHIRAAWLGQTRDVNESVYTHARDEDFGVAGGTLSGIFTPGVAGM